MSVERIAVKRRCGLWVAAVGGRREPERGVTRRSYSSRTRSSQSRRQRGITSQCPVRRILRSVVLRYCGTRHGSHASWSSLSSRLALRGSSICIDHRIEARPIVELKDEAEDKTLRPGRGRSYVSWPPMCSKKFSYFHDRPSYTVEDTGVHSEFTGA